MLNLAEFKVYSVQLYQLGETYDKRAAQLLDEATKAQAIKIVSDISDEYYEQMEAILDQALTEAAINSVQYHSPHIDNPEEIADEIVKKVKGARYYGLTYPARLLVNKKRLERNITRTGQILDKSGVPRHLSGVYTKSVPFGAQVNTDRRLLQATIEQIEHEAARTIAKREDVPLIHWRLAGKHATPDICDDLANHVDPEVVNYINEQGIVAETRGLYFRERLPKVPHPFCQCEFQLARETQGQSGTRIQKAVRRIRQIMNRIRGR